jgi:flagellar protein FliO/FliZ
MELFGGMSDAVKFLLVFVLILAILIPLLWRRFSGGPLSPMAPRNRQPRLAVVDTTPVDVRRRLVLIKRDNVEHLLMIGGPTDIVVEANISRTGTVAREPRPIPDVRPDAARPAAAAEAPDWSLPLEPMGRPVRTVDLDAALSEPPARTAREAMVDSMRAVRSGAAARRNPAAEFDTPLAPEEIDAPALTPPMEINHRSAPLPEQRRAPPPPVPQPPQPAPEPASSDAPEPKRAAAPSPPRPVPPLQPAAPPAPGLVAPPPPPQRPVQPAAANGSAAPPAPRPVQSAPAAAGSAPQPRQAQSDENSLAEMAQRLEAALRRPTKPAEAPPARPQGRPEPAASRKPANLDAAGPAKLADSPVPDLMVMPGKGRSEAAMESLEDEMAKMLGRSPGKS